MYPKQVHVDTLTLNKYTHRLVLHLLYMCTCLGVYMFACFGSNCSSESTCLLFCANESACFSSICVLI